ncbi:MAG TPA: hypothetical protein VG325_17685 [Solirubrobacteraceae bacterium]|jgi:hypothetical protein|nr:hypothetical protein [Solirubrobacteraceae bacterium]
MATGLEQHGGLFDWPNVPDVGYSDWATLSGMAAAHPLVGGTAGSPGYGGGQRQVAVADPGTASVAQAAAGSPAKAHWSELINLKGNPIGWVLIATILYLGLMHIHVRAGASASGGFRGGK